MELALSEEDRPDESSKRNIMEIGYGASQIIPVILLLTAEDKKFENALILVEQPELHLHPEAQAEISDLLIHAIGGAPRRLLVETHSEHLLLRLQRRIAETALEQVEKVDARRPFNEGYQVTHREVGVVFITRNAGKSQLECLELRNTGEVRDPSKEFQDFFRYDYDEVVRQEEMIAKLKQTGGS